MPGYASKKKMGLSRMSDEASYDPFWYRATAELKVSYFPRKCYFSKKLLFMTQAYKLTRIITGPGEPVVEDRWLSKEEFIVQKLKGTI